MQPTARDQNARVVESRLNLSSLECALASSRVRVARVNAEADAALSYPLVSSLFARVFSVHFQCSLEALVTSCHARVRVARRSPRLRVVH